MKRTPEEKALAYRRDWSLRVIAVVESHEAAFPTRDIRDEIQSRFGREVAGNHTSLLTFDDGSVLCLGHLDIDKVQESFLFIAHDEFISDWDMISAKDAKESVVDFYRYLTGGK